MQILTLRLRFIQIPISGGGWGTPRIPPQATPAVYDDGRIPRIPLQDAPRTPPLPPPGKVLWASIKVSVPDIATAVFSRFLPDPTFGA